MKITATITSNLPTLAAAHIHQAASGANGPVLFTIVGNPTTSGSSTATVANIPPDTIAAITSGTAYVNLHTAANPSGELRGQLLPRNAIDVASPAFANAYAAVLSGASGVPPVETRNMGYGFAVFDRGAGKLRVFVESTIDGGASAHVHGPANASSTAGVLFVLEAGAFTGNVIDVVSDLDQFDQLIGLVANFASVPRRLWMRPPPMLRLSRRVIRTLTGILRWVGLCCLDRCLRSDGWSDRMRSDQARGTYLVDLSNHLSILAHLIPTFLSLSGLSERRNPRPDRTDGCSPRPHQRHLAHLHINDRHRGSIDHEQAG